MIKINIANEFTKVPGPRYISEGPHSGEEFRETILKPKFEEARASGAPLLVELDGVTFGYPTSFLEEAFGGLARSLKDIDAVQRGLVLHSRDEPSLDAEIRGYIRDAFKTSRQRAAAG